MVTKAEKRIENESRGNPVNEIRRKNSIDNNLDLIAKVQDQRSGNLELFEDISPIYLGTFPHNKK